MCFLWLPEMLDLYYDYNYAPPSNVAELSSFIESYYKMYHDKLFYFGIAKYYTFPKLLKYENKVKFVDRECGFDVVIDGIAIYEHRESICCDSLPQYRDTLEWFVSQKKKMAHVLFFDKKNVALLNCKSYYESFFKEQEELKSKYMDRKKNIIDYSHFVWLEFQPSKGLRPFCVSKSISTEEIPFLFELENWLESFCLKHRIGKVIFLQYYQY